MLDNNVKSRAYAALSEFKAKYPDYEIAFASIAGSHSFGWSTSKSDIDIRGAYIVPTEEFANIDEPPLTIELKSEEYNAEFQMHEIKKFASLMISPNLNMLDAVFCHPSLLIEKKDYIYERLHTLGEMSMSKKTFSHIQGMVIHMKKHRMDKYNQYDPKKQLYLFRELMRGVTLFEKGKLVNDIRLLADEMPQYAETVEFLINKKRFKDNNYANGFLSQDEYDKVSAKASELEMLLNNAKTYGILRNTAQDDLRKLTKQFIAQVRRNYMFNGKH
jgi:predicted nucleotidyltransferase